MKLRKFVLAAVVLGIIIISDTGCLRRNVVYEDVSVRRADERDVDEPYLNGAGSSADAENSVDVTGVPYSEKMEMDTKVEAELPKIKVYVCGAVNSPGVYELAEESRICDAVELAGGYTEDADLTGINPAQKISDEAYIRICTAEEISEAIADGQDGGTLSGVGSRNAGMSGMWQSGTGYDSADQLIAAQSNGKINLNTASLDELMTLPGIGESKAQAILDYRREHGAYASVEEIMEISGIKNSVFNKIRDLITV